MKNVFLVLCTFICLYSCKKEDSKSDASATSDYFPMKTGNYWVYQEYDADTSGNMTQTQYFDSTVISKDTLINNIHYYKFDNYQFTTTAKKLNQIVTKYYRDSAKNIIDINGQIVFSETNFTDNIYKKTNIDFGDTIYWMTGKMEKLNNNVTIPAGNFSNVLNLRCTVICSEIFTAIKNPRYNDNYYAKEIGRILYSQFWIGSGISMEFRLVRFKLIK